MKKNLLTTTLMLFALIFGQSTFAQSTNNNGPCIEADECFIFTYLGAESNNNATNYTLTFTIQTNCNRSLSYAAFELPGNSSAITPNKNYNARFNYTVENTTQNPFHSIKFEAKNAESFKNGTIDTFRYTISASAYASLTTFQVQAKAANIIGTVTFDLAKCGGCPATVSIDGPEFVCAFTDTVTYTTNAGNNINWTLPLDWTLISGQNTNTIKVVPGFDPGNITVSGSCGSANLLVTPEDCGGIDPLPVELTSFEGATSAEGIVLTWATASEENNNFFDIEKSTDGKSFEAIAQVKGAGTSNSVNTYKYNDAKANTGINYYRLKQVDFDGTSEFSKIVAVKFTNKLSGLALEVYPNPVVDGNLNISTPQIAANTQEMQLQIYDLNGRLIYSENVKPGNTQINLSLPALGIKQGMYMVGFKSESDAKFEKLVVK